MEDEGIRWEKWVRFKEGNRKLSTACERVGADSLPRGQGARPVREPLCWRNNSSGSLVFLYIFSVE